MTLLPHKTANKIAHVFDTTFTGKERDAETGYSYFGARYYDSDLSGLFLSVDPMADKYLNISPYAYCVWNPLKLVDPNGMDTIVSININSGNSDIEITNDHNRGLVVQYMNNDSDTPIDEYICNGSLFCYELGTSTVIDFENDIDAENVYNQLSGRVESDNVSSVEWMYYKNSYDVPSQLVTSGKRDGIDVSSFYSLAGLTRSVRHYHPYYDDIEYSLPSPADITYSRLIEAPCYLDYCGKSYRFDNVVPVDYKNLTIGIIRRFVTSKILNYEPFCK